MTSVMAELRAAGSPKTRKTYRRHGVTGDQFGVKYGDLNPIAKRLGVDHEFAGELWATGNHDARILATKIEDPGRVTVTQADGWLRECDNYVLMEAVAGVVAASPVAIGRSAAWRDRKGEWVAAAGWSIVAHRAADGFTDAECRKLLTQIGREIHDRPDRVRHEMNMALIVIGMRSAALESRARNVAAVYGDLDVDHGETSCVTADANDYLDRIAARRG